MTKEQNKREAERHKKEMVELPDVLREINQLNEQVLLKEQ